MKKYTINDDKGYKKTIYAKDLAHAMTFVDSNISDAVNLKPGDVYLETGDRNVVYKVLKIDNRSKRFGNRDIPAVVEVYRYDDKSGKIERKPGALDIYINEIDIRTVFNSMNEAINFLKIQQKRQEKMRKYFYGDSIKDEANLPTTLQALINDEDAAIKSYEVAIKNLEGKIDENAMQVLINIRDDERRHIENLYAILNGQVTEKNLES